MTNLKLFWLGLPIIECDNTAIHMETRKATALLAFLGLSSAPPSRESVATLFWPEFDQTHALANLRRTLFSINKLLGPEILTSSRENVGINPYFFVWQDVSAFRLLLETAKSHQHGENIICPECKDNLEKAVTLYRGDFLEGVNLCDCPEFDDWQYMQREYFCSDLTSALEKLAHAYSANREWEKAILVARRWVNLDRLNERAQRTLILVFALAGQRSTAIRQYEECARYLQDELGQPPEKETTALVQKIQTGEIGRSIGQSETGVIDLTTRITNEPLIRQKLFIPHLRIGMISRPYLIGKLEQGTHCAVTLISAPAGYGKTTLLSEWIDIRRKGRTPTPWTVCWLSLDTGDNDPIRFLTYLTAALESAHPEISAEGRSILQSFQSLQPTTYLSMLINEIQEYPGQVVLVLDDYQIISNSTIHDGVIFLLEHLPNNFHLVISTRSDPPLPLALLRSRNQLNELRAKDLRFTSAEASTFLLKIFGLSLTPEQITILENRTEGWIAGLQMAALSMQGRSDIAQFIEEFSGTHRFIIDYLTEEALNRQSKETQIFLLRTSILERLNGPLCDFVLDRKNEQDIKIAQSINDVSTNQRESQSLLTELEFSNLFIVPLDDDRIWYRYHHLFADLLRSRLEQTSSELLPILHNRASAWFENNGWIEESIIHSLAAWNWDNVSRLIDLHFHTYLDNGQMATVLKWIEGLPQDIIFRYPKLCAQVAEVYSQAGMIDKIDPLFNRAEEILSARENHMEVSEDTQSLNLSPKDITVIRSMSAILRGLKAVCSGDPHLAVNFTQTALTNFPEMEPRELAVLFWVEGWAYRSLGKLSLALERLTKATDYALKSGANLHDIWTDLGNVTRLVGKLPQAINILTNSIQISADLGVQNQGNLSRDEAFLSFIFLEQNQLDLAFAHANRAIAYTQWWPSHIIIAMSHVSLSQILLVQGDIAGSLQAIQKADRERKNRLMTPFVHSIVDVTWARIWLLQCKWDLLDQWSRDQISILNATLDESKSIDEYLEMRLIMLVRVWIEKTKIDKNIERNEDCLRLLDCLENSSQTAGRINSLVEILFLREVIHFSRGNKNEAVDGLERCFSMAEPGSYMRIFLDTGEPTRILLSAYLQKSNPLHKSYALKILKAFGGFLQTSISTNELPEAITPREMEVLHLLAEGYSNRQIAEKLVLAEGTIKFHVHQLLGKLQVESRTQAIIRARDLELI
ncbi:MAG: BTAD domain-containing putative transcriptional regulator [Flexilinea sp.]